MFDYEKVPGPEIAPRSRHRSVVRPLRASSYFLSAAESTARIPMGRLAQPVEIARAVLFLASEDASYMAGSELVVDGGYTAA